MGPGVERGKLAASVGAVVGVGCVLVALYWMAPVAALLAVGVVLVWGSVLYRNQLERGRDIDGH